MQHADIVFRLLFTADENATVSVHPTVCPFRDPATGLESRGSSDHLGLLPTGANMCREMEFLGQLTDFVIVIPLVETQVLSFLPRRTRSFDGDVLDRLSHKFEVVDVRSRHSQP